MAFQKGKSGNPAGKPKGAKDKRTELRSLFDQHREELVQVVIDKAKDGDTSALRICIDRLVAPVRSNPVRIEGFTGSLEQRGEAVMAAIAAGGLAAEEGSALMGMLQAQARLVEATTLDERITALEKQLGGERGNGN